MPPDPEKSDSELIEACLGGDQRAWTQLVDRYANLVYSIPARTGLRAADRDDVFQTVWTLAVKHLGGLRDRETIAAWLITTTQRECWRVMRTRRSDEIEPPTWAVTGEHDAEDENELVEQRQHLRDAMRRLDQRCRDLLTAVFTPAKPGYDEIAARLGIPRGSIGPTRARCLKKLTSLLTKAESASGS